MTNSKAIMKSALYVIACIVVIVGIALWLQGNMIPLFGSIAIQSVLMLICDKLDEKSPKTIRTRIFNCVLWIGLTVLLIIKVNM